MAMEALVMRGGAQVAASRRGDGKTCLSRLGTPKPLRPWEVVRVWWNDRLKRWCVQLFPGFVNGIDPLAFGVGQDGRVGVRGITVASRRQQLGQATGEASGFETKPQDFKAGQWTPLLNGPHIELQAFRSLPAETENSPEYFVQMGAAEKVLPSGVTTNGETISIDTDKFFNGPQEARPLMAVDLWLSVARASLSSEITVTNPVGADAIQVDYSLGFDTSRLDQVGVRPRIQQGLYEDQKPPSFEERLLGLWTDPQEDILPLMTVYFIGPPGASVMSEGWLPFVKYHCFWNLGHAPRNRRPAKKPPPISLLVPPTLGAGMLIPLANGIFSQINQYSDKVYNALLNTTNAGKFWTQ